MYLTERYIAMLDILGLSRQTKDRAGIEKTLGIYNEAIDYTNKEIAVSQSTSKCRDYDVKNFEVTEFVFDTVVLVSFPGKEGVGKFIQAVSHLMAFFAKKDLPLRGAIGIGDYSCGENSRVFLSNIFKQLNQEEQRQQWSGCTILKSCEEAILEELSIDKVNHNQTTSSALLKYEIPFKGGSRVGWCLNWLHGLDFEDIDQVLTYLSGDEKKRSNTELFVEYYSSLLRTKWPLPEVFLPATYATIQKAGKCLTVSFWDERNLRANMGCKHFTYNANKTPDEGAFEGAFE